MNMNSLKKAASGAIGKAKSAIKSTVNKGKAIVKKAEKKLTSAINGAKANVKKCVQTVKTNVNKIENKAKQIGKTAQKNLISAVNGAKSSKKTVIQNQTKPINKNIQNQTKPTNKNIGNLQKSLIAATGTTVYNNAVIPTGKKQTNGAINVANLPVYNRAGNYIEGQKVKVKGLDGKGYVGTAKAEGYIGTGGARQFKFLPDNPGGYKRAIDVDYNYNLYKKSMFERAYNKNLDFTAQEIQGKIVHDAPWRYKKNALNDYFKTPNDSVEYNKKVYLISTEQYGFDPKVNEQYAQLAADFTVGMLFEGGITCGIVAKSGMSKAVAGSGAGNIKKGGSEAVKLPDATFTAKKLQHELKHSGDFGVTGNWNKATGETYQKAIQNHIDTATYVYKSTYRGDDVYVYINKNTGVGAYTDLSGNYVGGWKFSSDQINFHITNGTKIK